MTALKLHSAAGRWVVAGSVLGSGAVFLESSVVNVALPAIARDFHVGVVGLQWVINGYLLTLSALMLLGGALGDRFGRPRVFAIGCVAFAFASAGCALAPGLVSLVALRVVQGAAGALLVPNSLAMLDTAFAGEERGAAIGQWAAWSAVSTAAGPFAGGWLVDALSWRWVFSAVILFALVASVIVVRHIASDVIPDAQEGECRLAPHRLRGRGARNAGARRDRRRVDGGARDWLHGLARARSGSGRRRVHGRVHRRRASRVEADPAAVDLSLAAIQRRECDDVPRLRRAERTVLSADAAAAGKSQVQRAAGGRGAHAGERDHARALADRGARERARRPARADDGRRADRGGGDGAVRARAAGRVVS